MKIVISLLIGLVSLYLVACSSSGSSGSGSGTTTTITSAQEAQYSEGYTKLAVYYYDLIVKFNKVALFSPDNSKTASENMTTLSTLANAAVSAAETAQTQYNNVVAFNLAVTTTSLLQKVNVFDSTDVARKLITLMQSGSGPERLNLNYIHEKTGKSIEFLKTLSNTVKAQAESDAYSSKEEQLAATQKTLEFTRDVCSTTASVMATFAGIPVAAGAISKVATAGTTVKKIFAGAKAAYTVFQVASSGEDLGQLVYKVGVNLSGGDSSDIKIPKLTDKIIEKLNLSTLNTSYTLLSGITGWKDNNWGERTVFIADLINKGQSYFYSSDDSVDARKAIISDDTELIDEAMTTAELQTPYNCTSGQEDEVALNIQLDSGDRKGSYDVDIQLSGNGITSTTPVDSVGTTTNGVNITYNSVSDKTTFTSSILGTEPIEISGSVDLASGAQMSNSQIDITVLKKEQVITVPTLLTADSKFDPDELVRVALENATAPADNQNLTGDLDGSYSCSGDAAGACAFTVKGTTIKGWIQVDDETPRYNYSGKINTSTRLFETWGVLNETYNFKLTGYLESDSIIRNIDVTLINISTGIDHSDGSIDDGAGVTITRN